MANTFELISSVTVSTPTASISFSSIPATYTDLCILVSARNATAGAGDSGLRFNSDSGSNYSRRTLLGNGSGTPTSASSSGNNLLTRAGVITGTDNTANTFSNNLIYVPNYAGSSYKSVSIDSVTETNATEIYAQLVAGLWSQTSAITSITLYASSATLTDNFATNSTAYLYGVNKNA
jgi:hypothetical protein